MSNKPHPAALVAAIIARRTTPLQLDLDGIADLASRVVRLSSAFTANAVDRCNAATAEKVKAATDRETRLERKLLELNLELTAAALRLSDRDPLFGLELRPAHSATLPIDQSIVWRI